MIKSNPFLKIHSLDEADRQAKELGATLYIDHIEPHGYKSNTHISRHYFKQESVEIAYFSVCLMPNVELMTFDPPRIWDNEILNRCGYYKRLEC